MAIVEIPGGFFFPPIIPFDEDSVPGMGTYTLDVTTRKIAFILRAPKSGTLERFEFYIPTVAQSPANGLKVSFQDVSSGNPDNTADAYYVVPSGDIADNTWVTPPYMTDDGTSGGVKKTISRPDFIACVIEFNSFVIGDSLTIAFVLQDQYALKGAYILTADIVSAWTKVTGIPAMALVYDDEDYAPLVDALAVYDISSFVFSNADARDEYGLKFTLTAPMRVGGAYVLIDGRDGGITWASSFTIRLYDTETDTVLESVSVNTNDFFASSTLADYIYVRFDTDRLVEANKIYVLSVKPDDSNYAKLFVLSLWDVPQIASLPGGSNWDLYRRLNGGSWNEFLYSRLVMGLLVTGVDHEIGGNPSPGWEGNP